MVATVRSVRTARLLALTTGPPARPQRAPLPEPRPLLGASERLREAGGRFPKRWGRPRRGDSAVTPPAQVSTAAGVDRGALPAQGSGGIKKSAEERKAQREAQRLAERLALVPRLLDLDNAARYLGVSAWVVRDLEHAGRLQRVRLRLGKRDVRRVLYDVADLDALVERAKADARP